MHRTTTFLPVLVLILGSLAAAQESQIANPQTPEDAMATRQLIAWSSMQKPQPAPQPLPPDENAVPQPGQQPDQQVKPPADPQTQQSPATQSFTGKILRENGQYVLKVSSNTSYQLDSQDDVKQYENQAVKVIGNLNAGTNTIHVVKIELLS